MIFVVSTSKPTHFIHYSTFISKLINSASYSNLPQTQHAHDICRFHSL